MKFDLNIFVFTNSKDKLLQMRKDWRTLLFNFRDKQFETKNFFWWVKDDKQINAWQWLIDKWCVRISFGCLFKCFTDWTFKDDKGQRNQTEAGRWKRLINEGERKRRRSEKKLLDENLGDATSASEISRLLLHLLLASLYLFPVACLDYNIKVMHTGKRW